MKSIKKTTGRKVTTLKNKANALVPNKTTQKAIKDCENGKVKTYQTVESLFEDCDI